MGGSSHQRLRAPGWVATDLLSVLGGNSGMTGLPSPSSSG